MIFVYFRLDSPFRVAERAFRDAECAFRDTGWRFRDTERRFLLCKDTIIITTTKTFPIFLDFALVSSVLWLIFASQSKRICSGRKCNCSLCGAQHLLEPIFKGQA